MDYPEILEAICTYSQEGYIATDSLNKIVFINKQIENITGWKSDELIGQIGIKIYTLSEEIAKSKGSSKAVNPGIGFLYRKDGKRITLSVRQIELNNKYESSKGTSIKYLMIFEVESSKNFDDAKSKDDFVSTVSHELRTPLTSIKGFADTLLRAGSKLSLENQKKYLTIIKDQADRLTRLVEDLLSISKLESQSIQLTIRALELKKTIDKVCESLSTKSANHKIEIQIEEGLPLVWADADRLEQILTNLIDNAIKYSPGGSTISIKAMSLPDEYGEKGKVRVEVIDQGIGIGEKDLSKIFTRFGRLDNPMTRQTQGTGLGLFITKSLVLALKGEISVVSKSGGTTFTIVLPAKTESPAIQLSSSGEIPSNINGSSS